MLVSRAARLTAWLRFPIVMIGERLRAGLDFHSLRVG